MSLEINWHILISPGRKAVLGIMSMRRMSTLAQNDKHLSPDAKELATKMHKYMEDAERVSIALSFNLFTIWFHNSNNLKSNRKQSTKTRHSCIIMGSIGTARPSSIPSRLSGSTLVRASGTPTPPRSARLLLRSRRQVWKSRDKKTLCEEISVFLFRFYSCFESGGLLPTSLLLSLNLYLFWLFCFRLAYP